MFEALKRWLADRGEKPTVEGVPIRLELPEKKRVPKLITVEDLVVTFSTAEGDFIRSFITEIEDTNFGDGYYLVTAGDQLDSFVCHWRKVGAIRNGKRGILWGRLLNYSLSVTGRPVTVMAFETEPNRAQSSLEQHLGALNRQTAINRASRADERQQPGVSPWE